MIEIKNVSKSFGDKQILKGVSAVMESGKTNLIIGTSGSGKTVLQKCMVVIKCRLIARAQNHRV